MDIGSCNGCIYGSVFYSNCAICMRSEPKDEKLKDFYKSKQDKNKFLTIGYDVQDEFVDIKSDDFCITYINGYGCHGLQCYYQGGTERYDRIEKLLDDISYQIRELHRLATEDLED